MALTKTLWSRVTLGMSAAIVTVIVAATMVDQAEGHRSIAERKIDFRALCPEEVSDRSCWDLGHDGHDVEYAIRVVSRRAKCFRTVPIQVRRDGVILWAN